MSNNPLWISSKSVKPTSRFDPAKCRTALQNIDEYDLFSHADSLREIEEKVRASVLLSMKLRVRSAKTERLLSEQITLWIRTKIEAFCKDGFAVRFSSALLADLASLGSRVSKDDILDEFFEREKDAVVPMLASCGAFLTSYRCANGSIFRESPLIWFTQDEIMDSLDRLGFLLRRRFRGKSSRESLFPRPNSTNSRRRPVILRFSCARFIARPKLPQDEFRTSSGIPFVKPLGR